MATQFKIKGNQFIAEDTTNHNRYISMSRELVTPNRRRDGAFNHFSFTTNVAQINEFGIQEFNRLGSIVNNDISTAGETPLIIASEWEFADIVDQDELPFMDVDTLDLWLCTNLGSLEPAILPTPPKGIQALFINALGNVGTGAMWADSGFIGDLAVLLFNQTGTEKATYEFFALARIVLTDIDPTVVLTIFSVGAPSLGVDGIRWQLEVRYIANGELATKVADETLLQTQILTNYTANTRQDELIFTLDRTLITNQDVIVTTLSRLGNDAADTYNTDIATGESDLNAEVTTFNP